MLISIKEEGAAVRVPSDCKPVIQFSEFCLRLLVNLLNHEAFAKKKKNTTKKVAPRELNGKYGPH